jgi:hypothetical protein
VRRLLPRLAHAMEGARPTKKQDDVVTAEHCTRQAKCHLARGSGFRITEKFKQPCDSLAAELPLPCDDFHFTAIAIRLCVMVQDEGRRKWGLGNCLIRIVR